MQEDVKDLVRIAVGVKEGGCENEIFLCFGFAFVGRGGEERG